MHRSINVIASEAKQSSFFLCAAKLDCFAASVPRKSGMPFSFSSRIEAEGEVSFAFRISGGVFENSGKRWRSGAARAGKAD
jgi:hypothetical protein